MTTKGKIFIALLAVAVTVTAVCLACMNILNNSDTIDNETVSETDVEERSDLSIFFGGPVENMLTDFSDMLSDDLNTLYYNDEISVNVDRNGNILSISLEDDGTESLLGIRCGMTEAQVAAVYAENDCDASGYCPELNASVAVLYNDDAQPKVMCVEMWSEIIPDADLSDLFDEEYIYTDGEMNTLLGGTKAQLLERFPEAVPVETGNGVCYYFCGASFYFDENGRIFKEQLDRDSKIVMAGIATGMSYDEICDYFDYAHTEYVCDGNKIIETNYDAGYEMTIIFADDNTADTIINDWLNH